jgi:hypothetical protein
MFDFMGGPPRLEIIKEEPAPLVTPTVESSVVSATPDMPGPADTIPTVISEAGVNPVPVAEVIPEGTPMPLPDIPSAPPPDKTSIEIPVEKVPLRSSLKTKAPESPVPDIQAGDNVKVIKIDA